MNVRRRGFTLIEILVTIGIILILVGIASVGVTYVTKASKNNASRVALGNLRSMIAELEATAGLTGRQPNEWYFNNAPQTAPFPAGANVWKDANPATPAVNNPAIVPEGMVLPDVVVSNVRPRFESDVVANTQKIMQLLLAAPKNKTMLAQLPPEQLLEKVPAGATRLSIQSNTDRVPTPPILLDPWGNPIIFVPGAGLCGDNSPTADDSMWIAGGFKATDAKQVVAVPPAGSSAQVGPIRSSDGRPFWASAGPDGDFRTADDNVYSFEN